MDMSLLSKMIGNLLTEHDSISLPGLGTIRSELVGACFSERGYTINPPYRKLTFLAEEGHDSLLCELYAKDNGLSAEDSKAMLRGFLLQVKSMLGEKKTVLFPGIGLLRSGNDSSYIFIQDEESTASPELFGLAPLSLKNHQLSYETVPELKEIPQIEEPAPVKVKKRTDSRTIRRIILWTLFIIVFLLALLRIIGTVAPEYIDRLLYTPEELRIIYY